MPTSTHPPTQGQPAQTPPPSAKPLSVNQVVAYNLARARKAKGWTQAKAAEHLEEMTGGTWSAATVGAAERSYDGGRNREFNANELVAFSLVFDQPVSFFFIPPDLGSRDVVCFMDNKVANLQPGMRLIGKGVSERTMLEKTVPLKPSAQVVDDVNRVLAKEGLTWSPGQARFDWRREEEVVDWSEVLGARGPQHGPAEYSHDETEPETPRKTKRVGLAADVNLAVPMRQEAEEGRSERSQSARATGMESAALRRLARNIADENVDMILDHFTSALAQELQKKRRLPPSDAEEKSDEWGNLEDPPF